MGIYIHTGSNVSGKEEKRKATRGKVGGGLDLQ